MHSPSETKIQALLRLLSDPNEQVAKTIQQEFVRIGPSALPFLEKARADDTALESRVAFVKDEIRFEQLKEEFSTFVAHCSRQIDWEQGAFLIAKIAYPDVDIPHYQECLDLLTEEFRKKWHSEEAPPGKVARLLSAFLFKDKGFSGNRIHYHDPDNSYLHRVIESRQGIPISLSAIYVFVGNRLNLPLSGVGMPGHFLVKIEGEPIPQFVDCFNGGAFLREQDCEQFITASGLDYTPEFLEKSSTRLILARMLRNLLSIYEREERNPMTGRIQTLLQVLDESSTDEDPSL
ncbi:MAG TPA: transglutaminase-like domain-containing protein [Nitrospirales bacterium]|nr:transglutaminase-like domain-containing protein [Nitrospirales bacterium]